MSLKGLNIGRFDIRLTFESPVYTRNSNGEDVITSWSTVTTVYAERMRKPGGETVQNNQQVASTTSEYKIRHNTSINELMRCYEGLDTAGNTRRYVRDVIHFYREGYTKIQAEKRDNV